MSQSARADAGKQQSTAPKDTHGQDKPYAPLLSAHALMQRTWADRSSLKPADVLTLQRAIGNRSTIRLVQPHLQQSARIARDATERPRPEPRTSSGIQVQRQKRDEETVPTKDISSDPAPLATEPLLQHRQSFSFQRVSDSQSFTLPNHTGLSDDLKAGVEHLAGVSLSDVTVHRNSTEPEKIRAKAFARGSHIHVAPGEEKHLPQEAWHVAQQKQGRVKQTFRLAGEPINDSSTLEREATIMGQRALSTPNSLQRTPFSVHPQHTTAVPTHRVTQPVIQAQFSEEQIELIKSLSSDLRVEYLSRANQADLDSFIDTDFFDSFFTGAEEMDEIRSIRHHNPPSSSEPSPGWLDPIPDGPARQAARAMAFHEGVDETDFDRQLEETDAFLALVQRKVKIAYLEDCTYTEYPRLLDSAPPPHYDHPESGVGFLIKPGQMIFLQGYIIASKTDAPALWREHLRRGVTMSGEDGAIPGRYGVEDDSEIDELTSMMSALHLSDSEVPSMSTEDTDIDELIEKMSKLSLVSMNKEDYDAEGDVIMKDVDGVVDVDMVDVHGSMDIEMDDVSGYIAMELDGVRGDVDIVMKDVSGYVHLVLMDIDTSEVEDEPMPDATAHYGHMEITITEVGGQLNVEIIDYGEPMDVTYGPIATDEVMTDRVSKRQRDESEITDELSNSRPTKRKKKEPTGVPTVSGEKRVSEEDVSIDDLIESFQNLSVSFKSDIDDEYHEIYPNEKLDEVIVASNPTPLDTIIKTGKWQNVDLTKIAGLIQALKNLRTLAESALKTFAPSRTKGNGLLLRKALRAIAKKLTTLAGAVAIPALDLSTSSNYGNNADPTEGSHVIADPLSLNSKQQGYGPTKDGRLMQSARKAAAPLGQNKGYIQMHLLNDNTFGPGDLWNLTAGTAKANGKMESEVEDPLKRAVIDKGLVIKFEAIVEYKNNPMTATKQDVDNDPDKYFFKSIKFKAKEYEIKNGAYALAAANKDTDVKTIDNYKLNWDYGNLTPLVAKPKILSAATKESDLTRIGLSAADAKRVVAYAKSGTAPAKLTGTNKQDQLATLVKAFDNKTKKISVKNWKATDVLWTS